MASDRLDRLDRAVALLLAERFGGTDVGELRRQVKAETPMMLKEVAEGWQAQLVDATPLVQYTGKNVDAVREFVGDAASVNEDGRALCIVQRGTTMHVRAGQWVAQDPRTGEFYTTSKALEDV
jgi:hypothetical protein